MIFARVNNAIIRNAGAISYWFSVYRHAKYLVFKKIAIWYILIKNYKLCTLK